jgi:hypothetical protein
VFVGGQSAWKTGVTVTVPDGTPFNNALLSMLRFMGYSDSSFGSAGTGPLPGLGS